VWESALPLGGWRGVKEGGTPGKEGRDMVCQNGGGWKCKNLPGRRGIFARRKKVMWGLAKKNFFAGGGGGILE